MSAAKGSKTKNVIVYSTPTCPYCRQAKAWFAANNIPYQDFDVSTDHNALHDMVEKSGQLGVPVFDVDGEIVIGFDKPRLSDLLSIS